MNAISSAVNRCRNLYFCFINTSNKKSTCELQVLRLFCVILFLAEGIHPSTVVLSEGHSPVGVLTICGIAEPTGDSHGGEVGADDVCVFNRGADIYISALDKRRQNGNNYEIELMSNSELENKSFKVYFRKTNLKLTANDFNVSISSKGISTWVAQNPNVPELLFHIAVERDSLFEESGE